MKTRDHQIGDRVSVRCLVRPRLPEARWLGGRIIARDVTHSTHTLTRYVVQLDDDRRVVAFDDDVRRWTLTFDSLELLEKMAS